jgi:hypothetical protein
MAAGPPTPAATAPAATAPAATAPAANALLVALEREAQRRRDTTTSPADEAAAPDQPAPYTSAHAPSQPDPSPNQIVTARGDWDKFSASEPAAQTAKVRSPRKRITHTTGAIAALPGKLEDRVSRQLMLAYAAQQAKPQQSAAPTMPTAFTAQAVDAQPSLPQPPPATTIAVKRSADQIASTIVAARPRGASAAVPGTHLNDPWLEAIMISPSVRHYLTAMMLGEQDYRALAKLVEKPAHAVTMTFGAEPNAGMTYDRFSGSAIVFIPSVTYQAQTDTASLQ